MTQLIERCKAEANGHSTLSEAYQDVAAANSAGYSARMRSWDHLPLPATLQDLRDAIKAWQPPRPQAASQSNSQRVTIRTLPSSPKDDDPINVFSAASYKRPEYRDSRTFNDFPELESAETLLLSRRSDEVLELAHRVQKLAPDWWGSYVLASSVFRGRGDPKRATEMINLGRDRSLSTFRIDEEQGYLHLSHENLSEACTYWVRSLVIQLSIDKALASVPPAAYLSEIAKAMNLAAAGRKLTELILASRGKGLSDFDSHTIRGLAKDSSAEHRNYATRLIQILVEHYL